MSDPVSLKRPITEHLPTAIFIVAFSALALLGKAYWSPWSDPDYNTLWQMFLNVFYGSALAAILTFMAVKVQISLARAYDERKEEENDRKRFEQESRSHKRAVARQKKLHLFDSVLAYAAEAAYAKEGLRDVRKIERLMYRLKMYASSAVVEKGLCLFEAIISASRGEKKDKIEEFAQACHFEIYSFDVGAIVYSPIQLSTRLTEIQAQILGVCKGARVLPIQLLAISKKSSFPEADWLDIRSTAVQSFTIDPSTTAVNSGTYSKGGLGLLQNDLLIFEAQRDRRHKQQRGVIGIARVELSGEGPPQLHWYGSASINQLLPNHAPPQQVLERIDQQFVGEFLSLAEQLQNNAVMNKSRFCRQTFYGFTYHKSLRIIDGHEIMADVIAHEWAQGRDVEVFMPDTGQSYELKESKLSERGGEIGLNISFIGLVELIDGIRKSKSSNDKLKFRLRADRASLANSPIRLGMELQIENLAAPETEIHVAEFIAEEKPVVVKPNSP